MAVALALMRQTSLPAVCSPAFSRIRGGSWVGKWWGRLIPRTNPIVFRINQGGLKNQAIRFDELLSFA